MDERDDYAENDSGPRWQPPVGALVVIGFAAVVLVGCVTFGMLFGFMLARGR